MKWLCSRQVWKAFSPRQVRLSGSGRPAGANLRPSWVEPLLGGFPVFGVTLAGSRPGGRPSFLLRQERRQRNVPRCRAPFGGSLLPVMPCGGFANSPCGLKHAKPFFRPSSPPVGTSEGTGNAGDQRSVAISVSGEARCSSESPSEPLIRAPAGGAFRRGCLSPQGEFRAGRLLGAAQGSRPKADR